jgi:WD40 repeat protein
MSRPTHLPTNDDQHSAGLATSTGRGSRIRIFTWERVLLITAGLCLVAYLAEQQDRPAKPVARAALAAHTGPVRSATFTPDGTSLATVGADQVMRTWDVATAEPDRALPGKSTLISCAAFAPDGQSIVTGSTNGMITRWNRSAAGNPTMIRTLASPVWALTQKRGQEPKTESVPDPFVARPILASRPLRVEVKSAPRLDTYGIIA